jgi:hypothetical protein
MRILGLLLLALLLPSPAMAKDSDVKDYVFKEFYRPKKPDADTFMKLKHPVFVGGKDLLERGIKSGNPRFCKNYAVIDSSGTDRPDYYIRNDNPTWCYCGGFGGLAGNKDPNLCKQCPPKDLECDNSCPTLACSIRNNDIAAAKRLIAEKGNSREDLPPGLTFLHLAATARRPEIIKLLVDAGADVTAKDNQGGTPLGYAVFMANAETVKVLLDSGADPNLEAKIVNETLTPAEYVEEHNATWLTPLFKKGR